mgnify:CR=1 FL=1
MISTQNVSLRYGDRALFENVSVKFTEGNCYGIIGANGAGKSTFLKILAGEIEPNKGEVIIEPHKRLSVLKQDHFAYDENKVVETVIMGNKRLYEIMQEKEIEKLQAEKEKVERQLAQEQHKIQRLENRAAYYEKGDRRKRAHRLITRGAAIESVAPQTKDLSESAFYAFAEQVFALLDTQRLLTEAVSNHTGGD